MSYFVSLLCLLEIEAENVGISLSQNELHGWDPSLYATATFGTLYITFWKSVAG